MDHAGGPRMLYGVRPFWDEGYFSLTTEIEEEMFPCKEARLMSRASTLLQCILDVFNHIQASIMVPQMRRRRYVGSTIAVWLIL